MSDWKTVRIRVDVEVRTTVECYINGVLGTDGVLRCESVSIGAAEPVRDVKHLDVIRQFTEDVELGNEPLFFDADGHPIEVDATDVECSVTGRSVRLTR